MFGLYLKLYSLRLRVFQFKEAQFSWFGCSRIFDCGLCFLGIKNHRIFNSILEERELIFHAVLLEGETPQFGKGSEYLQTPLEDTQKSDYVRYDWSNIESFDVLDRIFKLFFGNNNEKEISCFLCEKTVIHLTWYQSFDLAICCLKFVRMRIVAIS